MKYIFIVQGEGRGHLTQAITLEKLLRKNGHEVVEILVGKSKSRKIPEFFKRKTQAPIREFFSPNFIPSQKNKKANIPKSIVYNILNLGKYIKSMSFINKRIKESNADIVINFYELLTGLTYLIYNIQTPQISIGHQYLFLHKDIKLPQNNSTGIFLLNLYTRLTSIGSCKRLALSFRRMDNDNQKKIHVIPPLLREEVLKLTPGNKGYIHGYMLNSGFSEYITKWHNRNKNIPLRFFWDKKGADKIEKIDETLSFYNIDDVEFLNQMKDCMAYASTAGFESICEAIYLGKPILMVPAHIEQECNAFDAMQSGVGIADESFDLNKLVDFSKGYKPVHEFKSWVNSAECRILSEITDVYIHRIPFQWILRKRQAIAKYAHL